MKKIIALSIAFIFIAMLFVLPVTAANSFTVTKDISYEVSPAQFTISNYITPSLDGYTINSNFLWGTSSSSNTFVSVASDASAYKNLLRHSWSDEVKAYRFISSGNPGYAGGVYRGTITVDASSYDSDSEFMDNMFSVFHYTLHIDDFSCRFYSSPGCYIFEFATSHSKLFVQSGPAITENRTITVKVDYNTDQWGAGPALSDTYHIALTGMENPPPGLLYYQMSSNVYYNPTSASASPFSNFVRGGVYSDNGVNLYHANHGHYERFFHTTVNQPLGYNYKIDFITDDHGGTDSIEFWWDSANSGLGVHSVTPVADPTPTPTPYDPYFYTYCYPYWYPFWYPYWYPYSNSYRSSFWFS